jgi:hypothetical protein
LVEQRTENPRVRGSIPRPATIGPVEAGWAEKRLCRRNGSLKRGSPGAQPAEARFVIRRIGP